MRTVLTLTLLAFATEAAASQAVRVVYAPMTAMDAQSKKLAAEMDKTILQELSDRAQLFVVQREAPSVGADSYNTVTSVHASWLADADKAIEQGKHEQAVGSIQRYLFDLKKRPESANLTLLGRAYLALAVTQFRRGKEDEGQEALDELVRLRPDVEVVPSAYPPLFVRLYGKALQRWKDRSTATLVIEGPEDVDVSLNGRRIPAGTVNDVPAGVHYVSLTVGTKQIVRKVEVLADEVKQVSFGSSAQKGALASNRFDRAVKRALASVANRQGAPFIVTAAAGVVGSELVIKVLFVSSDATGGLIGDFSVDLDLLSASIEASKIADRVVRAVEGSVQDNEISPLISAAAVTGQMATLSYFSSPDDAGKKPVVEPEPTRDVPKVVVVPQVTPRKDDDAPRANRPIVVAPGGSTVTPMPEIKKSTPVYKQWWLWTIIGVAVAGGVTAGVLVGTARVGNVAVTAEWK